MESSSRTPWALLPPVIAITLALVTKEVYSSLFVGILAGGLLYSNFSFEGTILHVFNDGIVSVLSDSYNVGILVFLVILGVMVCLMNKAGGSAAFGRWAAKNIKSRAGAQLATIALGILIFIDDYFNCLTVGSVMRPVTDKHNVSRAKLSYLIDALGQIVSGYLDFAERQAERQQIMTMKDWAEHLDRILTMSGEQLLQGNGKISHDEAVEKATVEYKKYQQKTLSDVEKAFLDSIKEISDSAKEK